MYKDDLGCLFEALFSIIVVVLGFIGVGYLATHPPPWYVYAIMGAVCILGIIGFFLWFMHWYRHPKPGPPEEKYHGRPSGWGWDENDPRTPE